VEGQQISDARGLQATFFGRYEIQVTIFGKSNLSRLPTAPNPLLEPGRPKSYRWRCNARCNAAGVEAIKEA
jgi:hypothetical protein